MRSQLSARLLQNNNPRSVNSDGEVTPWWKRGSSYKNAVKAMPLSAPGSLLGCSRPAGESSGYNADSERTSTQSDERTSPPISIDFRARDKKKPSSPKLSASNYEQSKKRKFEEDIYNAAVAKEDIIRAGLTVPMLQTNKAARLLADNTTSVSMSRVEHVYSNDADDSPFWGLSLPLKNVSTDLYNDAVALSNIVKTCVSYYPCVSMSPSPTPVSEKQLRTDNTTTPNARDYESSTSSVTEDMDSSEAEETETTSDPKPDSAVVSIGDALSLCQDARYVHPFVALS